jgi:hypothetical protein
VRNRCTSHLENFETFATDAERTTALDKLAAKRNLLIRKAQQMIDEGIEFSETERPKSLRPNGTPDAPPAAKPAASESEVTAETQTGNGSLESVPSPFAGTSFDYRPDLLAYKKSKAKQKSA